MSAKEVVLISGASRGIGFRLANDLTAYGYTVIGGCRSGEMPREAKFACMLPLDVSRDDSARACVQETIDRFGHIDGLINNAAYPLDGPAETATLEQVKAQFEVNFYGALRMIKAVLPVMRCQGGGKIINISSGVSSIGFPFMPYYTASKCALEGLSRVLRREVMPFGVYVSVIQPDWTRSSIDAAIVLGEESIDGYEPECSAWINAYRKAVQNGVDPSTVSRCMRKVLAAKRPRYLYHATPVVWGGKLLKGLLPEAIFYRLMRLVYQVE